MNATAEKKITLPVAVIDAVLCQNRVDEPPHDFYKYPARFSPMFAREIIREFSSEGEVVLDPFCGGGTTVLEAMSQGRRAAGIDVSTLATFIARTKTTPLSVHDRRSIEKWCNEVAEETTFRCADDGRLPEEDREHYERNLPNGVRSFFAWVIYRIADLDKQHQQAFVRLILLAVGQWALDCKTAVPNKVALRDEFVTRLRDSIGHGGDGTGLGLFVTRQLLLRDNCTISLDSRRNEQGRLYRFVLNFSGVKK